MSEPDRIAHTAAGEAFSIAWQPRSLVHLMARKGKAQAVAAAVKQRTGLDLPPSQRWVAADGVTATWLQPGGWLLEAQAGAMDGFHGRVATVSKDLAAAVDQSQGRSLVRVAGRETRTILATCCRLDLHPRDFGPGSAASTLVAHVPCVIRALEADAGFDLVVGSTYARWLIEELLEASAVCGGRLLPAGNERSAYRSAAPAPLPPGSPP